MSLVRCVEVKCDGRADGTTCPDSLAWGDYQTATELRDRMRAAGWLTSLPGGIDRCPDCGKAAE